MLADRLRDALVLVRDLLRAPEFPEREVARLKDERLAELLQLRAEPRALADEQFSRAVYAPTARYAAPAGGSAASVRALTRDVVRGFYAERYRPAATTLVFAGDVSVEAWSGADAERPVGTGRPGVRNDQGVPRPAGGGTGGPGRRIRS